jgi:MFS family permease
MNQLSVIFGKTTQQLSYANGACLINQGIWNCVWMPFAVKYGRRPVYLASTFLMILACIWLAIASNQNYTTFIVGRAFLGAWEAPIESIVPSTITDMFFLHNRGELVSLYGLAVLGGNELGPMFSGFIVQALGMNWAFWIVAMFIAANLVSMFFFMPETKFIGNRPSIPGIRNVRPDPQSLSPTGPTSEGSVKEEDHISVSESFTSVPKKTWSQELKFWSKGDPDVNLFHVFLRPFVLLAYPTVVWSCFVYGLALSWNVILGAIVAQLFTPPPYGFNSNSQGLFFLSPFVGSLFGVYFSGPCGDWIANYFTKRNHGIREPEMRLPICLVAAFFTFFGALWFALSYEHQLHWAMPVVGAGILSVGSQMGTTLGMNYALDCHQEVSFIFLALDNYCTEIYTQELTYSTPAFRGDHGNHRRSQKQYRLDLDLGDQRFHHGMWCTVCVHDGRRHQRGHLLDLPYLLLQGQADPAVDPSSKPLPSCGAPVARVYTHWTWSFPCSLGTGGA